MESVKHIALGLIVCLTLSANTFGQPEEMLQVFPDWQIGDIRIVETKTKLNTIIDANPVQTVNVTGKYRIEVIDTTGRFLLEYSQESSDLGIDLETFFPGGDSVSAFMLSLADALTEETKNAKFLVQIDKDNGIATDIQNAEELLELLTNSANTTAHMFGQENDKSEQEIADMQRKMTGFIRLFETKIFEGVLNTVNLILQIYAVEFAVNSTVSYDMLVHDVNTLGKFGDTEFPAVMTVYSVENSDHTLDVSTDLSYDKAFFVSEINKQQPGFNLSEDKFDITEQSTYKFDLETGWIINYTEKVDIHMGKVASSSETKVSFRKP